MKGIMRQAIVPRPTENSTISANAFGNVLSYNNIIATLNTPAIKAPAM